MKKHIQIFTDYHNISLDDRELCWVCDKDYICQVHHVEPRGMGGSKTKDYIENLLGCCFKCHQDCEKGKYTKEFQLELIKKHL